MIEQAVHIRNGRDLSDVTRGRYTRVYWGEEFCEKRMPQIMPTRRVFKRASSLGMGFTLVVPFVTERGLTAVLRQCEWLAGKTRGVELVANDWGLIHAVAERFPGAFSIALGRLLVRQQRMPLVSMMLQQQPPLGLKSRDGKNISIIFHKAPGKICRRAMRSSYINAGISYSAMKRWGIGRVELNNVLQGVDLEGIRFKKSLYTPLVHVSTTRYCPMDTPARRKLRIAPCAQQCRSYYRRLTCPTIPFALLKMGNSVFYENRVDPDRLPEGVDRLVEQLQGKYR